jgi:hypothetical protein
MCNVGWVVGMVVNGKWKVVVVFDFEVILYIIGWELGYLSLYSIWLLTG